MSLVMRTALVAPARPSVRTQQARRVMNVRVMSAPAPGSVEKAIKEAEDACATGKAADCSVAWDTVEELSAAADKNKKAEAAQDPLEKYCEGAPEADECRVYED